MRATLDVAIALLVYALALGMLAWLSVWAR